MRREDQRFGSVRPEHWLFRRCKTAQRQRFSLLKQARQFGDEVRVRVHELSQFQVAWKQSNRFEDESRGAEASDGSSGIKSQPRIFSTNSPRTSVKRKSRP